jgi:hypothetical protein
MPRVSSRASELPTAAEPDQKAKDLDGLVVLERLLVRAEIRHQPGPDIVLQNKLHVRLHFFATLETMTSIGAHLTLTGMCTSPNFVKLGDVHNFK